MREILFRGKGDKKYNDGAWYYGVPIKDVDDDWQICTHNCKRVVMPDTIGQYTGLTDKNGKYIYEGDIIQRSWCGKTNCRYVVTYDELSAMFIGQRDNDGFTTFDGDGFMFEIIGNIFDNPEMFTFISKDNDNAIVSARASGLFLENI